MQAAEEPTGVFAKPILALGDKPEVKMGIYIACHGELKKPKDPRGLKGPPGVTINKQNLGGYGACSYRVTDPSNHIRTALSLQDSLVGCSLQDYEDMDHGAEDKHGRAIDKEGACEIFSSTGGYWIPKEYKYDATKRAFIIAFQGRTMDMVTCTRKELEEFIGGDPTNYKKNLDDFFAARDTYFDTQILFNLIFLFSKHRGVNVANISDESCNVYIRDRQIVPRDAVFSRGNSGYGGKRTRKYRKSKTRRRK